MQAFTRREVQRARAKNLVLKHCCVLFLPRLSQCPLNTNLFYTPTSISRTSYRIRLKNVQPVMLPFKNRPPHSSSQSRAQSFA